MTDAVSYTNPENGSEQIICRVQKLFQKDDRSIGLNIEYGTSPLSR